MIRQWVIVMMGMTLLPMALSEPAVGQVVLAGTYSFQNGLDGYNGGVDATIYSSSAYENQVDPGRLRMQRSSGTEHANTLIRFEGLEALAGASIEQAYITLRFQFETPLAWTDAVVDVYGIQRDWSGAATWSSAENGEPDPNWILPGVQDVGERGLLLSSLEMGDRFFFNGSNNHNYDDEQAFDFALDPNLVKSWASNPATNVGVLLVMNNNSDVLFSSNEDETLDTQGQSMKPKLTVVVPQACPGASLMDLSGDGFVDYFDFSILESGWGSIYGQAELVALVEDWLVGLADPDLNGDGFVDYYDFQLLNSGWLLCYDVPHLLDMAEAWLTCGVDSVHPNCEPGE